MLCADWFSFLSAVCSLLLNVVVCGCSLPCVVCCVAFAVVVVVVVVVC